MDFANLGSTGRYPFLPQSRGDTHAWLGDRSSLLVTQCLVKSDYHISLLTWYFSDNVFNLFCEISIRAEMRIGLKSALTINATVLTPFETKTPTLREAKSKR